MKSTSIISNTNWALQRSTVFHKRRYKTQHEPERVVFYSRRVPPPSSPPPPDGSVNTSGGAGVTALTSTLSTAALQMNNFFPEASATATGGGAGMFGGRQKVKVYPSTHEYPSLSFDDDFESGNLQKVIRVDSNEYDLELRPDQGDRGNRTMWFYFQITNIPAPGKYTFNILNLVKPESLYNEGLKPCVYSRRERKWQPAPGGNCCYFASHTDDGLGEHYILSFELTFVDPPTAGVSAFDRESYEYNNNLQHRSSTRNTECRDFDQDEDCSTDTGGGEGRSPGGGTGDTEGGEELNGGESVGSKKQQQGNTSSSSLAHHIPWYRDDVICLSHTFPFTCTDLSLYIATTRAAPSFRPLIV